MRALRTVLLVANFGFVVDNPTDQFEATGITELEVSRQGRAKDEQPEDDPWCQLEQQRSGCGARGGLFVLSQQKDDVQHADSAE